MESALDRFARTRGVQILGATGYRRMGKIQTALGGAFLAVGSALALAPLAGASPELAYGAIGPLAAGLTNLALGLGFRRHARQQPTVPLTDEARALLQALVARAQVWSGGWRPRHPPLHGPQAWPGYRAPVQPSASAMDALDRAAAAHNRVLDALGEAHDERAGRLRLAADAGMGEALHLAATQTGDASALETTVARLEELAGLVQSVAGRPDATSALRSNLEATIEELRAEAEAVRELGS